MNRLVRFFRTQAKKSFFIFRAHFLVWIGIVCIIFGFTNQSYSQTLLHFVSSQTKDSISQIIILTTTKKEISTGNYASYLIDNHDFPIQLFRTGFTSRKVEKPNTSEITVFLEANTHLQTIDVIAKQTQELPSLFQSIPIKSASIDSLTTIGIATTKTYITTQSELQLRDFGSIGGLQTFTSRGTTSAQNLVTINGIIVNDLTTGSANLTQIPFDYFSSVNLQTGGFSSDISNGAFGSILSFNTAIPNNSYSRFEVTKGSFNTTKYSLLSKQNDLRFFSSYETSQNDFPFFLKTTNGIKIKNRTHNEANLYTIDLGTTFHLQTVQISSDFFFNKQESGVPGPVYFDNIFPSKAKLFLTDFRNLTSINYPLQQSLIRNTFTYHFQSYQYTDPEYSTSISLNDHFYENEVALRTDYFTEINHTRIGLGQYTRWVTLNADQRLSNKDFNERVSSAVFSSFELPFFKVKNLTQKLSLRFEKATSLPFIFSGSYSVYFSSESVLTGFSMNQSNRYPSMNELHFTGIGNPILKPEKLIGLDLFFSLIYDQTIISIKGFAYNISNKIISYPKNPIQWVTMNAEEVGGYGIEQSAKTTWLGFIVSESATYNRIFLISPNNKQTNHKQLIYTPLVTITGEINRTLFQSFQFFSRVRWTSQRFTSTENLTIDRLPSFYTTDIGFYYLVSTSFSQFNFRFQVQNLTNQFYEWIRSYPQPGRSYQLTIGIQI